MPKTLSDKSVLYEHPDIYSDVRVNSQTYADHNPLNALVHPNGYGVVHFIAAPDIITSDGRVVKRGTFLKEKWIDGQYKSYFLNGIVKVTLGPTPAKSLARTTGPTIIIS